MCSPIAAETNDLCSASYAVYHCQYLNSFIDLSLNLINSKLCHSSLALPNAFCPFSQTDGLHVFVCWHCRRKMTSWWYATWPRSWSWWCLWWRSQVRTSSTPSKRTWWSSSSNMEWRCVLPLSLTHKVISENVFKKSFPWLWPSLLRLSSTASAA